MPPTVAGDSTRVTRRIWPITATLVVLASLLMVYQLLTCALIVSMGFTLSIVYAAFPDTPSFDDYIPAAMACLTTLPAFAAMIGCGWQRGSRLGLLLIGVPAALMALVGLVLLTNPPVTSLDPQPMRALSLADLFSDLTLINWGGASCFSPGARWRPTCSGDGHVIPKTVLPHSLGECLRHRSTSHACGWSLSTPPTPTSGSGAT